MMVCHVSPMWNEIPKDGIASQLFSCSSAVFWLSRVRSAATRGWSFPSLAVSPHLSTQSWTDNFREKAGQRFRGDLNTEEILAGDDLSQTSAEAQHRLGPPLPPPPTHTLLFDSCLSFYP